MSASTEPPPALQNLPANQILKVTAEKVTNTSINFMVTCYHRLLYASHDKPESEAHL